LILTEDILDRAKQAKEEISVIEQKLEASNTLSNFNQIMQAFRIYDKFVNAKSAPSKSALILALPVKNRSAAEREFVRTLFETFQGRFRNDLHLVFTYEEVFQNGKLNALNPEDVPVFEKGKSPQIIVLANPEEGMLTRLQNKTGFFSIPEVETNPEGIAYANYAVSFMLADILAGLSPDEAAQIAGEDGFRRLLSIALGSKYTTLDLKSQTPRVARAMLKVDREALNFYKDLLFALLKPFKVEKDLELERMLLQAIGAAA